jgi:PRTRC genetic system protein B
VKVPKSKLSARLDFYDDAIISFLFEDGVIHTKTISADDLVAALLSEVSLATGLLPQETLWYQEREANAVIALWRSPRIWLASLQLEALKPARRFKLPMPGLIFVCTSGQAPSVYAVKHRPGSLNDTIYHAPLFNVYSNGRTCPGSHKYPKRIDNIPEDFFISFFSVGADTHNRSKKYPDDLLKLWEELDGQSEYPLDDLVSMGQIKQIIHTK